MVGDGGAVAGQAATPKEATTRNKEATPKEAAVAAPKNEATPQRTSQRAVDGGIRAAVVDMSLSPKHCVAMNRLGCLAAHRLVHHKTYRTEYDDHEFLHYACHPPTALGLNGCAQAVQELCNEMDFLGVKDWGLRIDAHGAIAALVSQQEVATSGALQSVVQELSGKVWSAVPVPVPSLEESDDEGDVVPENEVLWRTSKAPGTCVVLDRQKVERFICTVGDKSATCLLMLRPEEHHALWRHLAQFLRMYEVGLERIDVSHGSWMQSKGLHLKLTVADKASYVQLHDKISRMPFARKQVSKRK